MGTREQGKNQIVQLKYNECGGRVPVIPLTRSVMFDRSHLCHLNSFIYETGTVKPTSLPTSHVVIGIKGDKVYLNMPSKLQITVQM